MLMSLVSLEQGNVKKSKKLIKIVNIDAECRKCSYLLTELRTFNEIFRKDVPYDNIKSRQKPEFHLFSEKHVSGNTIAGRDQIDPLPLSPLPPAFLGLMNYLMTKLYCPLKMKIVL